MAEANKGLESGISTGVTLSRNLNRSWCRRAGSDLGLCAQRDRNFVYSHVLC
jgi:hypothetical protein